jgi:hypothetical protein
MAYMCPSTDAEKKTVAQLTPDTACATENASMTDISSFNPQYELFETIIQGQFKVLKNISFANENRSFTSALNVTRSFSTAHGMRSSKSTRNHYGRSVWIRG